MTRASTYNEPFESFVAPARSKPQIWRVVVAVLAWFAIGFGFAVALAAILAYRDPDMVASTGLFVGTTPLGVVSFLSVFVGAFLGIWLITLVLHRRGLRSLIGRGPVLRNFIVAAGLFAMLQAINVGLWHLSYDSVPNVALDTFLAWLPILIAVLVIQTGAEELLCRGYLMQQLAARFASRWVWMVIPQVFFALLHFNPATYGPITWVIIGFIFILAMLWADLTRITGNLGAAWGWHFANNFIVFGVFGSPGDVDGLALRVTPYDVTDTPMLAYVGAVATMVLTWVILRRLLRP